jgi:hypothetical protein
VDSRSVFRNKIAEWAITPIPALAWLNKGAFDFVVQLPFWSVGDKSHL